METPREFYKQCVKQLLAEYETLKSDDATIELIFDDEHQHYMAYRVGWFKHKRIHFCLVHIDICDDMVIIQANNTEDMIDEELVLPCDVVRDDFVVTVYQGREAGVFSDEEFEDEEDLED